MLGMCALARFVVKRQRKCHDLVIAVLVVTNFDPAIADFISLAGTARIPDSTKE